MAERQQFADKYTLTGKEPIAEIESHIRDKIEIYHQQNNDTYRQWLLNAAFGRGQQWGVIGSRYLFSSIRIFIYHKKCL